MAENEKPEERPNGEPAASVRYWTNEITAAQKREKNFRKTGQRVIDIYDGKKPEEVPYNILFSNTETLLPALYSAVPRPVVQRRFKDDDPLGKSAADAGRRGLEFLLDTNVDGYETFDEAVRKATLDGLLPGRGITCVKYDAEVGELPTESVDDEVPDGEDETGGSLDEPAGTPYKESELVCTESRSWNRVFFGYAKKWSKVPWIAYEEYIDEEEAIRLFGKEKAAKLTYTDSEQEAQDSDDRGQSTSSYDDRNEGERKTVCVYQIWDKSGGKKIRYMSPQYADGYLRVDDDPLQLTGFYNCPKPLMFMEKSNDLLPTALYMLYENQAEQVNEITRRITRVVRAIKAKAVYDSELGDDIKNLVEADDNELVPADKSSSLAAEKGLQNAIWFWPIEQLVATLNQLILAREQAKRVIYEITGISDIIRGSSVASETATAQNLKSQWGTLRLKRLQKEVQRYARDILRMMLEVAATKFSEETWAKMTGLPFLLEPKYNELTAVSQALQMQAAQEQAMMPPPAPGTPPQPSPAAQKLAQVQKELQTPTWAQILEVLRDDMQRAYRIDIETNSTVEPEAAEDQKNIADLLNALGQYLNGVGPLVAKGMLPFGVAQNMMLAISRRFRFGSEIEDDIKQMQAPPPQDDGKAAEQAKMQADLMKNKDDKAAEVEKEKIAAMERDAEANRAHALDVEKVRADAAAKMAAEEQETLREQARLATEERIKRAEAQSKKDIAANAALVSQETELQKAAIATAGQIQIAQITAASQERSSAAAGEEGAEKEAVAAQDGAAMKESLAMMAEALRALAAPKMVERDKNGKAMRLVPQVAA